mgnify:CR=1 FL=1
MWTWSFTIESIAAIVGTIGIICGAIYRCGISPILTNIKKDRENDIKFITTKYDTLIETLKELKEEIDLTLPVDSDTRKYTSNTTNYR